MDYTGLSLDAAPPLSVPLRFFLAAPAFGIAAALLTAWVGPSVLASRWTPATLATVHLLTVGYLSMVMAGALLQLLPVLAGARVGHERAVAAGVHGLLCAGTPLLAGGFLLSDRALLRTGAALLVTALAALILAAGRALAVPRTRAGRGLALALTALAATLGLAAWLAGRYLTAPASRPVWVDMHLTWGLFGWVGLLLITVAHQVVPMFQMTPAYPAPSHHRLVPALFLALLLWSAAAGLAARGALPAAAVTFAALPIAAGGGWFAAAPLWLQHRRRRRLPDVTVAYWRLGTGSLLRAAALWGAGAAAPAFARDPRWALLLGVLVIIGFGVSVIHGMLCKILPFLVWLHLHRARFAAGRPRAPIPPMKELLPERAARRQFHLQCLALVLLAAATVWPQLLTRPAALALAAAFAEFWRLALGTAHRYRRLVRPVEE